MLSAQTGKTIETYLNTVLAGATVKWPNVDTADPEDALVYEPHIVEGETILIGFGRPAKFRMIGQLVVKIMAPRNIGMATIDTATDLLFSAFALRILNMNVTPGATDGGAIQKEDDGQQNRLDTITQGDVKFQEPTVTTPGRVAHSKFQKNFVCVFWSEATVAVSQSS